jgi:hypothetical protein
MPRRRPLTPEQLASIRDERRRAERDLEAYTRGERPAPGFEKKTMPTDPAQQPPKK